jgi:hypothetical protein
MSVIVPISSALPLKADVAAVGRESPKLTQLGHWMLSEKRLRADHSGAWFVYCAPLQTVQNQQPAYRGHSLEPVARQSLQATRTMPPDATGDRDVTVYPPLNDSSG